MRKRLGDYYPIWLEFVILFIILLGFYFVITAYPGLPEKVPTHFGASGKPDAWTTKSWKEVLILPLTQTGLYVLITVVSLITVGIKNPLRFINLPISKKRLQVLNELGVEKIRKLVIHGALVIKGILSAMFTYLIYASNQVAMGRWKGLGQMMWVFIAILFVTVGIMTFNAYRVVWEAESKYKPS
ncbi:DUF1648 domain-containing protein [candidate division WOR-3 bacterium]|nr:DUF1648 domain-containing protein [candidate division WOR-3 bacterium]